MAQLRTAGGLISTLLAPEPMRFSRTGAGAPHCSRLTGSDTSTSAAIGASSRTHSRKAVMIWSSDHTSGLGGSGCAASDGGSGVLAGSCGATDDDLLLLPPLSLSSSLLSEAERRGASTGSAAGEMAEVLCPVLSLSVACDRLALERRATSSRTGSASSGTGLA